MIEALRYIVFCLPGMLPFFLLALLAMKVNLKKQVRSSQILMPAAALIYVIAVSALIVVAHEWIFGLLEQAAHWLMQFLRGLKLSEHLPAVVMTVLRKVRDYLLSMDILLPIFFVENVLVLLIYLILKRILISVMKAAAKKGGGLTAFLRYPFYEEDNETHRVYLRKECCQARTYLKVLNWTAVILFTLLSLVSCYLYHTDSIRTPMYPVMAVILIGEISYILGGITKEEEQGSLEGEEDDAEHRANYFLMRKFLRSLFGDKLSAESTTSTMGNVSFKTNNEVLEELEEDGRDCVETYGYFLGHKIAAGFEPDHAYVSAGKALLEGRSILFNNPFYYDLIPYIFYPMNRQLLCHKKILIVLGRLGVEDGIRDWCREGFAAVNHTPTLWTIGVMGREDDIPKDRTMDVGILPRFMVHDLEVHEKNAEFLSQVGMMILIEPSRLMTTAQIGLNSLVRYCSTQDTRPVFCSVDKNCDGLLDALSHVLMVSLTEVSATSHHMGTSSYMCWEGDSEHLQHRMLPDISRYLGFGTELSIAALKNQISETAWYGGDAFPVVDIRWIAGQYYYDLLDYAALPTSQETLDATLRVTPDMWSARQKPRLYLTVEDESNNLFEIKREFATRAEKEGFINIISSEYLLKDYMTENEGIFNADPKAVPYLVADYAHTARNVVLRLCLRMSVGTVWEEELQRELLLIDASTDNLVKSLWHEICRTNKSCDETGDFEDILILDEKGRSYVFTEEVIHFQRKFNLSTGTMENSYSIRNAAFIRLFVDTLKNAEYIAEDERGNHQYLGSEIFGQVFQKHLPGQFLTLAGKNYEMLRVSSDHKMLLRRAADHITGRHSYRQVRAYRFLRLRPSERMGDVRETNGLQMALCYADMAINTPAYWNMDRNNDFTTAHRVSINGVPERKYFNKRVLRLSFEGGAQAVTGDICRTLTILINELFATLFAENQSYIVALTPGEQDIPITCTLEGSADCEIGENCIYIVEDSPLDIGLLEAVQRNVNRIFSILCDYLEWHLEAVENSLNPPPEPEPEKEELYQETKKGFFARLKEKIKGFFARLKELLRKLFGRKKKTGDEPAQSTPEESGSSPDEDNDADGSTAEEGAAEAEASGDGTPAESGSSPDEDNDADGSTAEEGAAEAEASGDGTPAESGSSPDEDTEAEGSTAEDGTAEAEASEGGTPEESGSSPDEDTEAEESMIRMSEQVAPEEERTEAPADADVEYEAEEATKVSGLHHMPERKPYHERFYLLFGGQEVPEGVEVEQTLAFLKDRGYDNSELKQARLGKQLSKALAEGYMPDQEGRRYCDFCGTELTGTEYEVLRDGRERCMSCGRTAIKSEKEFTDIYHMVLDSMQTYYGIKINVPIAVKMVNSKRLHRALGKTFTPTSKPDARVLGVAISSKGKYSLLLENGSPRMSSIMTIAHELTHIWQYVNWDAKAIRRQYGKANEIVIYEGMAKWTEIQYAYLMNEPACAKREEIITRGREDEYGKGFRLYESQYPLTEGTVLRGDTPFTNKDTPVKTDA